MKQALTLISSIFIAGNVLAACSDYLCVDVRVDKLYVSPSSNIINIGTSGTENNLSCTPFGNYYVQLDITKPTAKEAYSTLLAAQIAKKQVNIILASDSNPCAISYLTLADQ